MKILKNRLSLLQKFVIIVLILLTLINTSIFNSSGEPCESEGSNTIIQKISGTNIDIDVSLEYDTCYVIGTNGTFNLTVIPYVLDGTIDLTYIQIYFNKTDFIYSFLTPLGGSYSVGSPFQMKLNISSSNDEVKNFTADIWFKLGYRFNGTDFGQFESSIEVDKKVNMVYLPELDSDSDEVKIWFLFFPLEPYQFALVIVGIVVLVTVLVKRSKKKKKSESETK